MVGGGGGGGDGGGTYLNRSENNDNVYMILFL